MKTVEPSTREPRNRPVILVVDDDETIARIIATGLSHAGYDVQMVYSGQEALQRIAQTSFDVMISDIYMPNLNGDELQRLARDQDENLAVVLMTGAGDITTVIECMKDGVYDYVLKPFSLNDIVVRVGKAVEKRRLILSERHYQTELQRQVVAQAEQLKRTLHGSLEALIYALEAKDPNTRNHSMRVSRVAVELARRLRPRLPEFEEQVRVGALFHDIGKIGIPEATLNKRARLTPEETEWVRRHPEIGETILQPLLEPEILQIVRHHHEHYNGNGYPDGLSGQRIPFHARVVAVADAFDAMTSMRPYRPGILPEHVLEIFRDGAGIQWDPIVVHTLLQMASEGSLARAHTDSSQTDADGEFPSDGGFHSVDDPYFLPLEEDEFGTMTRSREQTRTNARLGDAIDIVIDSKRAPRDSSGRIVVREHARHILYLEDQIDNDMIGPLREQIENLLRHGERQIYLDLSRATGVGDECIQSVYALSLSSRRVNGRLVLRDVPEPILSRFQSTGLARMLRFENSPILGRNAVATAPPSVRMSFLPIDPESVAKPIATEPFHNGLQTAGIEPGLVGERHAA